MTNQVTILRIDAGSLNEEAAWVAQSIEQSQTLNRLRMASTDQRATELKLVVSLPQLAGGGLAFESGSSALSLGVPSLSIGPAETIIAGAGVKAAEQIVMMSKESDQARKEYGKVERDYADGDKGVTEGDKNAAADRYYKQREADRQKGKD